MQQYNIDVYYTDNIKTDTYHYINKTYGFSII